MTKLVSAVQPSIADWFHRADHLTLPTASNAPRRLKAQGADDGIEHQNPWIMTEIAKATTPNQKTMIGSATRSVARPSRSLRRTR